MTSDTPSAAKVDRQKFHLGTILTITHDKLLSPDHMESVYKILNFMTGDSLLTHQLPRVAKECTPHLLRQHPFLANIDVSDITHENWQDKLDALVRCHGQEFEVEPVPPEDHEWIDPISELAEKVHPDKIIVVTVPPEHTE